MIVLIAFIYIASMLFCGDGVGKKFVEENFRTLHILTRSVMIQKEGAAYCGG